MCFHICRSSLGEGRGRRACRNQGAWKRAMYCAILSIPSRITGVTMSGGRTSPSIAILSMYNVLARNLGWCNAPDAGKTWNQFPSLSHLICPHLAFFFSLPFSSWYPCTAHFLWRLSVHSYSYHGVWVSSPIVHQGWPGMILKASPRDCACYTTSSPQPPLALRILSGRL